MAEVENAEGKAVIDPQDPLPESNWQPRRQFVFGTQTALSIMIAAAIGLRFEPVIGWLVSALMLNSAFYLIAPSAEQVLRGLTVVTALRGGITFASSSSADVRTGEVRSEATATPAVDPKAGPED